MTVSSLVPVNNYTGNGSTCQFDFDFLIEDESELVVTLINKKENIEEKLIFGVDYSINEIGSKNGSFIIYPLEEISSHEVLSPDEVLSLSLNLSIKQESEFENSATLKLDVLEWTFDYIVRVLQILSRKIDRSIKIVEGENTKPEELVKNLFDAEFNSKAYSKAAYQNLQEIIEMNNKINSDMKKLDYELTEVLHKSGDEEVTGVKNFTNTILYKGENLLDVVSQDYESAIQGKQDKLIAGDNIIISNNVISAEDCINDKITNCILEVPQRIKYTLQNGTLTIKAGSVVIVPYGTEDLTSQYPVGTTFLNDNFKVYDTQFADGKFFVWAELQGDCTGREENTTKADRLFFIRIDSNVAQGYMTTDSGIEDYTGTGNCVLYRTDLNKMKHWNKGTATNNVYCFPLGVVIGDGTYLFGSIKQVFNGFGYIGSYVWKDKGVKALSPNGFNNNGTFANIEVETERLNGRQLSGSGTFVLLTDKFGSFDYVPTSAYDITSNPSSTCRRYYNPIDNFNYNNESGNKQTGYVYTGTCTLTDGKITSFDVKQPVRLVDYNDIKDDVHIIETYSNETSWYRIWSDGWCEQGGHYKHTSTGRQTISLLLSFINTNYSVWANYAADSTQQYGQCKVATNSTFTCKGYDNNTIYWWACGYVGQE